MDYTRIKATADRLIGNASQGTLEHGITVTTPGATPLDAPTQTTQWETYHGVARGASLKYVDGSTILATDLQLLLEGDTPVLVGHRVRIDSIVRNVIRIDNIPAAGIVAAKRVFVR